MYDFIQSALTSLIQVVAIAGFGGCLAHYLWTSHTNWMATYCPPVAPYSPELPHRTEIIVPTLPPLETSLPQPEQPQSQTCEWASPIACLLEDCPESSLMGQSYELTSPPTCEWSAPIPVASKRRRGRPRKNAAA